LAREVRGRFFALRAEDFVTAARLDGSSERRLIFRHILPSLTSHILAVVTLALPTMIVAETALSFLGIGLKAPVVSWGVLLQEAQNVRTIATAPWLLLWPGGAVVLTVLAYNFLGDGLRDAADPYEA
jgi:peptide/nickel transport system permease protein